ncbi:MAG: hypothetical protein Q4D58_00005, partial [Synergistaceae bacterium]|nr:hypothetical protein [Synergistaceae bacterium]
KRGGRDYICILAITLASDLLLLACDNVSATKVTAIDIAVSKGIDFCAVCFYLNKLSKIIFPFSRKAELYDTIYLLGKSVGGLFDLWRS